jgi:DNA-directed RNA polymerase subunit N
VNKYETYQRRVHDEKEEPQKVLDELGYFKFCCRRMFLSHVSLDEILLKYPTHPKGVHRIGGSQRPQAMESDESEGEELTDDGSDSD